MRAVHRAIFGEYLPLDWIEDREHENGSYVNTCSDCDNRFVGHKRRYICKECYVKDKEVWDSLTEEQKTQRIKEASSLMLEILENSKKKI
jgi:hypothetical protein